MRDKIIYIIIGLAFVLQPFFSAMLPVWLVPDLDFCILTVIGLTMDPEDMVKPLGLLFGLALVGDIYASQHIGVTVSAMAIVLIALLLFRRLANVENLLFALLITTAASAIFELVHWGMYALMSSPYSFVYMAMKFPQFAVPNVVVTTIALFVSTRELIKKRRDKYFR